MLTAMVSYGELQPRKAKVAKEKDEKELSRKRTFNYRSKEKKILV